MPHKPGKHTMTKTRYWGNSKDLEEIEVKMSVFYRYLKCDNIARL